MNDSPTPPAVSRDQLLAFLEKLPPEVQEKLVATRDAQTAIDELDRRIVALTAEGDGKRKEARAVYRRAREEKQFKDFPWARALAGSPVDHAMQLPSVVRVTMRPPTGERLAEFHTWHSKMMTDASKLLPLSGEEMTVLTWVNTIQQLAPQANGEMPPVVELKFHDYIVRLGNFRKLPVQLVRRIAVEANELESWLGVVMEDELGN